MFYMHFITFSNFLQLIKRHLPGISTYSLLTQLFDDYLTYEQANLFHSQISRWTIGDQAISAKYAMFYQGKQEFALLEAAVERCILSRIEDWKLFQTHWQDYVEYAEALSDEFKSTLLVPDKRSVATVLLCALQEQVILRSDLTWL